MANETIVTIVGNLADDPVLRFLHSGVAVANLRLLSTPRTFDRQANEYRDSEALAINATAWRDLATNVAESLTKGMRVIVQGRLTQRSYETREGEKRTVVELEVDEIGPSLRFATAKVQRAARGSQQGFRGAPPSQRTPGGGEDPWATQSRSEAAARAPGVATTRPTRHSDGRRCD